MRSIQVAQLSVMRWNTFKIESMSKFHGWKIMRAHKTHACVLSRLVALCPAGCRELSRALPAQLQLLLLLLSPGLQWRNLLLIPRPKRARCAPTMNGTPWRKSLLDEPRTRLSLHSLWRSRYIRQTLAAFKMPLTAYSVHRQAWFSHCFSISSDRPVKFWAYFDRPTPMRNTGPSTNNMAASLFLRTT